jgi:hypothetical protein
MKEETDTDCGDTRTPYEKFEDLAKQVFTVPKKEIDKREEEYQRNKPHKKRAATKSKS